MGGKGRRGHKLCRNQPETSAKNRKKPFTADNRLRFENGIITAIFR
jgi:hypothetical protein